MNKKLLRNKQLNGKFGVRKKSMMQIKKNYLELIHVKSSTHADLVRRHLFSFSRHSGYLNDLRLLAVGGRGALERNANENESG